MIEKNDTKIGVIGASPFDFKKLAFVNEKIDFIDIKQLDETIESVEQEAQKLKRNGAEIIFLLAHTGEYSPDEKDNYYDKFANIDGINVVVGGHDHRQVDRWIETDSGSFAKIISTGQSPDHYFEGNLDIIGLLNLEVENGELEKDKCISKFQKIENDDEIDDSEVVFELEEGLKSSKPIFGHSEIGNIVADSNLWFVNSRTKGKPADFAFVNAGTIRSTFSNKEVTLNDIRSVVPFTNSKLIKTDLTKKQIIDTLNWCAESTSFGKVSPGMMQVSNLEYTVNPDLSVSDVHILNDDGSIKYNLDDFDDDDKFCAVYDDFLMTGVAGLKDLKKDYIENPELKDEIEFFYTSRQQALEAYLNENEEIKEYESLRIKT